jgi:hypothetical protein
MSAMHPAGKSSPALYRQLRELFRTVSPGGKKKSGSISCVRKYALFQTAEVEICAEGRRLAEQESGGNAGLTLARGPAIPPSHASRCSDPD